MRYVVKVRCEFKTDLGWDYLWNEHSGRRHATKESAEKELKVAQKNYFAIIEEEE